jgi:hypothetical protein
MKYNIKEEAKGMQLSYGELALQKGWSQRLPPAIRRAVPD